MLRMNGYLPRKFHIFYYEVIVSCGASPILSNYAYSQELATALCLKNKIILEEVKVIFFVYILLCRYNSHVHFADEEIKAK